MNRLVVSAVALLMGAASMVACGSDDDNKTTPTTGGQAGAEATGGSTGGSTGGNATAGSENGGAPEATGGSTAGAPATGGTAGAPPVSEGGKAGAPVAEGGAPMAEGGKGGAPVAEGGAGGGTMAEGGAGGGTMAEGGAGGATGFDTGNVCEDDNDCSEGATCFEGICVMSGALQFTLTWEGDADLDLYVIEPDEDVIYYGTYMDGNPEQANTPLGYLDVDDCAYGPPDDPSLHCRSDGVHVENIFFDAPEDGNYTVFANGYFTDGATVPLTITVTIDGVEQTPITGSVDDDEQGGSNVSTPEVIAYGD